MDLMSESLKRLNFREETLYKEKVFKEIPMTITQIELRQLALDTFRPGDQSHEEIEYDDKGSRMVTNWFDVELYELLASGKFTELPRRFHCGMSFKQDQAIEDLAHILVQNVTKFLEAKGINVV
jgi:hypothetical protein